MKPKTMDEIRDELATEQCQQIIKEQRAQKKDQFLYRELSDELFWKCGFDASTSHHQKIIADLVDCIELVSSLIVNPVSMGDAKHQLFQIEQYCNASLAAYKQIETKEQG